MYVVGLRVTGLVITTIPAIVLRPDPPTTGLNTSLADPDGQWTATASAKIIENRNFCSEAVAISQSARTTSSSSRESSSDAMLAGKDACEKNWK